MTNLHTDIPTRSQVDALMTSRSPASVAIYLATDPVTDNEEAAIELKNFTAETTRQLEDIGIPKQRVRAVHEELLDLVDDREFWRFQARSLAIFATPERIQTFRLPNHLPSMVEVSDRMHLKPLLRSITFPQTGFVLALAQGSVRLLEILPDAAPIEVRVPDLPSDVADAAGKASIKDRAPVRRIQGTEGQKVRMRQYARKIDDALRTVLPQEGVPLILAGSEPLLSIFRSVTTYPSVATPVIEGNPEKTSDLDLVAAAREVLDQIYADRLRELHELYAQLTPQGRTASDVSEVARLATQGAVDTVLVDIDSVVPGTVDSDTGAVHFSEDDDAIAYGVVDEIARRVWLAGGRALAVRSEDIPDGSAVAAILRYSPV